MRVRLFALVVSVVVAGLLLAGVGGGTASAAFPGRNGKIVFDGELAPDGHWGLWAANADTPGTVAPPLEIDTVYDGDAAWSPDGTKIAFSRGVGIWVMNADGSGQRRLTSGTYDVQPAWSPDGTRIAFQRGRAPAGDIFVMNADGSEQADITNNHADNRSPAWSPDGTKIAFNRGGGIFVMNPDGSNQRKLPYFDYSCGGSGADWSPDGSKIAFVVYCHEGCDGICSEIAVMNADGSNETELTRGAFDDSPAWSPDGTKIAFTHCNYDPDHIYCPKYRTHIWVMSLDGDDKRNVTSRFYDVADVDWQPLPLAKPTSTPAHPPTKPPLAPGPVPAAEWSLVRP
jgi:Tol biopolymer transport system component